MKEVLDVLEVVARIDDRLADRRLVRSRGNRADLRHQRGCRVEQVVLILGMHDLRVVSSQGVDHGRQDRHRLPVGSVTVKVLEHRLVQRCVLRQEIGELVALLLVAQLPEDHKISCFDEA